MNAEVKRKWVEALRSGEYRQTRYQLRREDAFCCLGVLCDLHARETEGAWEDGPYRGRDSCLPDEVTNWAGLTNTDPRVQELMSVVPSPLTWLNDVRRLTFGQIADLIEAQL